MGMGSLPARRVATKIDPRALSRRLPVQRCQNARIMKFKTAFAALLTVALFGCQAGLGEKDFVGEWTSKIAVSDADLIKQIKASGGSEKNLPAAKKFIEGIKVIVAIKADKTYTMGQSMNGTVSEGIVGKWAFVAPKLTLIPVTIRGMTVEEFIKKFKNAKPQADPLVLNVDKDGKTLTGTAQEATMSFTKTPAAK